MSTEVKLDGFRSQLQASYVSSHTKELQYNEPVCLWMIIYIYIYTHTTSQKYLGIYIFFYNTVTWYPTETMEVEWLLSSRLN